MRGARALLAATLLIALSACQAAEAVAPEALSRAVGVAPVTPYPVGVRTLDLTRGPNRPLPTTVWYPADGRPGEQRIRRDARPAAGRFPIVLFSHGLASSPQHFTPLLTRWAAAGFVIAAPAYPFTHARAADFQRWDVRNQPGDAEFVIQDVIRRDTLRGDPFKGRLDVGHVAAAGHSAGGFTTAGLFIEGHDPRLRAGVVIAGGGLPGTFAGPEASLLFVHGGADPVVAPYVAKAAYDRVPWPKAFVTLAGQGHGEYLTPGQRGFPEANNTITDFLRWTLYGDASARARLPIDATLAGVSTITGKI
ncbi:alpha/beta hydrolase family protein [Catenuloplanes atrovinosus]